MTANVWVVRHDNYHPRDIIDPAAAQVFAADEWNLHWGGSQREILAAGDAVDLAVVCNARADGEEALSPEEERGLVDLVRAGMGMLRLHAGLVLIEADSPLQQALNTGRFISHPRHDDSVEFHVDYAPLRGVQHPILESVTAFGGVDEHYWCQVDVTRTDLLLASTSVVGTAAAGWAHQVGRGRVAALTPGHTAEVLLHPSMQRLLANAARWCARP